MGFAPTRVKAADGRKFTLNWTQEVFAYRGYKGRDLELDKESNDPALGGTVVGPDGDFIRYFWGDYPEVDQGLKIDPSAIC